MTIFAKKEETLFYYQCFGSNELKSIVAPIICIKYFFFSIEMQRKREITQKSFLIKQKDIISNTSMNDVLSYSSNANTTVYLRILSTSNATCRNI